MIIDNYDDVTLLVFEDKKEKFLDTRLITTELNRTEILEFMNEYCQRQVTFDICDLCEDKECCRLCKHVEFDTDDFIRYGETMGQIYEIDNSGIICYNHLKVNTK